MSNPALVNSSFRDPDGFLTIIDDHVFRFIKKSGQKDFLAFLNTKNAGKLVAQEKLISSTILTEEDMVKLNSPLVKETIKHYPEYIVAEHERIAFPSFPYEWSPEMLYTAGCLTLDIALQSLDEGFGIKDATPYNILFKGPDPIFIDVLSFEARDASDYIWLPYAQFVRTFILPLIINKYFKTPLVDIFLNRRDGIEPEEVYHLCSKIQRLRPPFLANVSIPKWMSDRHSEDNNSIYQKKQMSDPERARFILQSVIKSLQKNLKKLQPANDHSSVWSDYMEVNNNYSDTQFTNKYDFVKNFLVDYCPKKVLDVGCNTGVFSALAAKNGSKVVAIDYDPVVVGRVWRQAAKEQLDILPLVVNLTRPTPATGWQNRECPSFLSRARGNFDAVFMLAVIHHMMVSERIPLSEIIDLAADMTTKHLIIEYIDPSDSMFRRLTRGRDELFTYLNREFFESTCNSKFEIVYSQQVADSKRWIYLLKRR